MANEPKKSYKRLQEEREAVKMYVAKLSSDDGNILHRSLYKMGITSQDVVKDAIDLAEEHGFYLDSDAISAMYAGHLADMDKQEVFHEGHNKTEKNKGWVVFHLPGASTLKLHNFTADYDDSQYVYTADFAQSRKLGGNVNENGWLEYDELPPAWKLDGEKYKQSASQTEAQREQAKKEAQARIEATQRESQIRYEQKAAELAEKKRLGKIEANQRYKKSIEAHARLNNSLADGQKVPAHGNHVYLQGKFGQNIDHFLEGDHGIISDSIAFSKYKPGEPNTYPLLVPVRDFETKELVALQRIFPEKNPKDWSPILKEDGSYKMTKKFMKDTGPKGAGLVFYGELGDHVDKLHVCEGVTDALLHKSYLQRTDPESAKDTAIVCVFSSPNMAESTEAALELCPNATVYVDADNDYKNTEGMSPEEALANNSGLKAAYNLADEYGAVVVYPPVKYLKPGDSDWGDVFHNIRELATERNEGVEPPMEEWIGVYDALYGESLYRGLQEKITRDSELLAQADKTLENIVIPDKPSVDSGLQASTKSMMLSMQDPNFKELVQDALKTTMVLPESQHWSTPPALTAMIEVTDTSGNELYNMHEDDRKEVLRSTASDLSNLMTGGVTHDSTGIPNMEIINELANSEYGWQAKQGYKNSLKDVAEKSVVRGVKPEIMEEPKYLREALQQVAILANDQGISLDDVLNEPVADVANETQLEQQTSVEVEVDEPEPTIDVQVEPIEPISQNHESAPTAKPEPLTASEAMLRDAIKDKGLEVVETNSDALALAMQIDSSGYIGWGNGYVIVGEDHPSYGVRYEEAIPREYESGFRELTYGGSVEDIEVLKALADKNNIELPEKGWVLGIDSSTRQAGKADMEKEILALDKSLENYRVSVEEKKAERDEHLAIKEADAWLERQAELDAEEERAWQKRQAEFDAEEAAKAKAELKAYEEAQALEAQKHAEAEKEAEARAEEELEEALLQELAHEKYLEEMQRQSLEDCDKACDEYEEFLMDPEFETLEEFRESKENEVKHKTEESAKDKAETPATGKPEARTASEAMLRDAIKDKGLEVVDTNSNALALAMQIDSFGYTGWGNGYVIVGEDHPSYGVRYEDALPNVYQGAFRELTYSGDIESNPVLQALAAENNIELPEKGWVLGIDSATRISTESEVKEEIVALDESLERYRVSIEEKKAERAESLAIAEAKAKAKAEAEAKAKAEAEAKAKAEAEAKAKAEAEAKAKAEAEAKAKAEAEAKAKAAKQEQAKREIRKPATNKEAAKKMPASVVAERIFTEDPPKGLKKKVEKTSKSMSKEDFVDHLEDKYYYLPEEADIISETLDYSEFKSSMAYIRQDMGIKDHDVAAESLYTMVHEIHTNKVKKEDSDLIKGIRKRKAKLEAKKQEAEQNPEKKDFREALAVKYGLFGEEAEAVVSSMQASKFNEEIIEIQERYGDKVSKMKAATYVASKAIEQMKAAKAEKEKSAEMTAESVSEVSGVSQEAVTPDPQDDNKPKNNQSNNSVSKRRPR